MNNKRTFLDVPGVIPFFALVFSVLCSFLMDYFNAPVPMKDSFMLYGIFMCAFSVYRLELKVLK